MVKSQLCQNPQLKNLILYLLAYAMEGALLLGIGPLIPYYAQKDHRMESQYSIVLLSRTIGYVAGSFLVKILEKCLSIHQCLAFGLLVTGIFSILFNYSTSLLLMSITLGFASFGLANIDIMCNVGTI